MLDSSVVIAAERRGETVERLIESVLNLTDVEHKHSILLGNGVFAVGC
jgi:hypothetical protein